MIARGDFDSLTTPDLTAAAGVSQPTLYNLIGSKNDILRLLVQETFDLISARLERYSPSDPLDAIEAVALQPIELHRENEPFYRAGGLASDRLFGSIAANAPTQDNQQSRFAEQAIGMAISAIEGAVGEGLLKGRLPNEAMAEQLYICFRGPYRDLLYGMISINECRTRTLRGFYMILAGEASEPFRAVLESKFLALSQAQIAQSKCA